MPLKAPDNARIGIVHIFSIFKCLSLMHVDEIITLKPHFEMGIQDRSIEANVVENRERVSTFFDFLMRV